jgi:hypothetical protein
MRDHRRWLALSVLLPAMALAANKSVPVRVAKYENVDACPSLGAVSGLKPKGDGFLSVRSGPGTSYRRIDELSEGQEFWLCDDGGRNGEWIGIVCQPAGQHDVDCGVTYLSYPKSSPYPGPCKSGWIHSRWTKVIAG